MGNKIPDSEQLCEPTRRALLGSLAVGVSGLAGCPGGGGDGTTADGTSDGDGTGGDGTSDGDGGTSTGDPTPTSPPTARPHVSGQTLTWYTMQNPENFTWLFSGWLNPINPTGDFTSGHVAWDLTMQHGMWGPASGEVLTGDVVYEHYDSIDFSPEEITVTIRDDATWSNGDDLTAQDALLHYLQFKMQPYTTAPHNTPESETRPPHAVTDYEVVDDKTFTVMNAHGSFERIPDSSMWSLLSGFKAAGGVQANTSQEPYDQMWEITHDAWQQYKNDELHPWSDEDDWSIGPALKEELFAEHGWSEDEEENEYDGYWEEYFQDPDNVTTTGAWKLGSISGTQRVILVPNENHYAADEVNFDEIEIVAQGEDRAVRASLSSDNQDYYLGTVPSHIVDSFPDSIEERTMPAGYAGLGFAPNHDVELFSDRKARQAIFLAIDRNRIAQTVHRSKFEPVQVPGGNAWDATEVLGQDWIDENLQSYERDVERANQLMQEAGFERSGGNWVNSDGETLSVTVPTSQDTPQLAPAFANQLSQFGINASIQTYSESVYTERLENGDFAIFRNNYGTGFSRNVLSHTWLYSTEWETWAREQMEWFPDGQLEDYFGSDDRESESARKKFTLEAPPIGEPGGDLQTYYPNVIAQNARYPESVDDLRQAGRKAAWLINWYLPNFPIANGNAQQFLDTAHWNWPSQDSLHWQNVDTVGPSAASVVASGKYVTANAENPESGANVE